MVAKRTAKGVALKLPMPAAPEAGAGPKDRKRKRAESDRPKQAGKGAGKNQGGRQVTNETSIPQKGKGKGKGEGKGAGRKELSRNQRRSKEKKKREKEEKALPKKKRKRLEKKKKEKATREAARAERSGEAPSQQAQQQQGRGEEPDKKKKKLKASEVVDAQCRKGHTMLKRTENPAGYNKPACCDKCGMANLPRKVNYFFHCSFCKWDVCPNCILAYRMEGKRAPKHIRERLKEEKEGGNGKLAARDKKKEDQRLGLEIENREFTKERREIWLPTDATAVSRAPTTTEVISDWVEGMPV